MPLIFLDGCGGFCEEYRNGGEDVELGLHIGRQGHRLCCVPGSRITHLVSQTPGRHDHEAHNGQVLKARCLSLLVPDLALLCGDSKRLGMAESWLAWMQDSATSVDFSAVVDEVAGYMEALRQGDVAALYRNWRPGAGR